jgi:hypothetical protein
MLFYAIFATASVAGYVQPRQEFVTVNSLDITENGLSISGEVTTALTSLTSSFTDAGNVLDITKDQILITEEATATLLSSTFSSSNSTAWFTFTSSTANESPLTTVTRFPPPIPTDIPPDPDGTGHLGGM